MRQTCDARARPTGINGNGKVTVVIDGEEEEAVGKQHRGSHATLAMFTLEIRRALYIYRSNEFLITISRASYINTHARTHERRAALCTYLPTTCI